MAHALADDRRAHPGRSSAATSSRRKTRTGIRRRSGSTCATDARSAGSTSAAASSGPTRTTTSAATRSSGAACSTGCGARTSRRVEHVDGVSPAWPIDYDTLAPYYDRAEQLYHVHGEAGVDPTEPPRGAVSVRRRSARAGDGGASSSSCARRACTLRRCRSGCCGRASRTAASCATPATRSRAGSTRRARPTSAACARRCAQAERHAVDATRCARRLITDAAGARVEAVEVERERRDACASRRRSSSCRAAPSTRRRCCCDRRTTRIPTGSRTRPGSSAAATWRTWRR